MDNYYGDKYNLDSYSVSAERPRVPRNSRTAANKNTSRRRSNGKRYNTKTKDSVKTSRRKTTSGKSNPRNGRSKKGNAKKKFGIFITVFTILLICAVAGIVIWENRDTEFRFSENVSVSGIDISKLTYKEAKAKVEKKKNKVVKDITINITAKEFSQKLGKKDFTYKFYIKEALQEAKIYSLKEQRKYKETSETKFVKLENPDFPLNYAVEDSSIESNVKNFADVVNREYTNARVKEFVPFSDNRFIYQEATEGYQLVEDELTEKISSFFESGSKKTEIEASVNVFDPEITSADLKERIVGLSKATSISYNTQNGNTNMRVALEACNGSVIEPGEVWSFNECTGDSNLESNGYKPATVINQQELTEGVGGGLCQASTTIFRAAIFANMTIYQRYNHFWASSYAYPGEDATIDYPNLDLKLYNSTEYQMFMECKMEGTTLTVNIYGYQEPHYDNIKIYSKNHDVVKKKSYKTTTYRVLYLDGKIVKEEVLCNSTYSLKDGVKVKAADKGTFRTMVDGTVQYETEPPTEKPTTETTETTETKSEEETTAETEPTQGETETAETAE